MVKHLSSTSYAILDYIQKGNVTNKECIAHFRGKISEKTVNNHLRLLHQKGLVGRIPDLNDMRGNKYFARI